MARKQKSKLRAFMEDARRVLYFFRARAAASQKSPPKQEERDAKNDITVLFG